MVEGRSSWWVGLDREQLRAEIAQRLEHWRAQRKGFLDYAREQMREGWEPRAERHQRRDDDD